MRCGAGQPVGLLSAQGLVPLALAVALLLATLDTASADPSLDELREQRQRAEERHSELSEEQETAQARLDELSDEMALAVEEYNQATVALEALVDEVAVLLERIGDVRRRVAGHEEHVSDLLRTLYKNGGSANTVDSVLGADAPPGSARRLEFLQGARRGQQTLVERFLAERAVLAREREELAVARTRQRELTEALERQREALEAQVVAHEEEVAELEAVIGEAERAVADARQAEQAEEGRLERERRERERREREQREEEEQRRLAAAADRSERRSSDGSHSSSGSGSSSAGNPSGAAQAAVNAAMSQVGVRYQWGGASPSSGFDCSGLTSWAYAQAGVAIPRTSGAQHSALPKVDRSQLRPGDLVFFNSPISHVGMYIGGGQMVEAPHSGASVRTRSIDRSGWAGAARPTG